ncbi:MAG: tetratricopeptide repeat protein [Marinicella pacifica]
MQYRIKQINFSLQANQLNHGTQVITLTDKTMAALLLFLRNPQSIISKDEFMQTVWGEVIVSEASLFKQIQICRGLLQQIGLPEDSIENVYGKGYRLKYAVNEVQNAPGKSAADNQQNQFKYAKIIIGSLVAVVIATLLYTSIVWFDPVQTNNQLTVNKRQGIIELSKSDWQAGLTHINDLLTEEVDYSPADLGFLYQQQGQALLELQRYSDSAESLQQAIHYFKDARQRIQLGETHILLSRAYGALSQNSQQTDQVHKAVTIFSDSDNTAQAVDSLMELAFLYKKAGDFGAAIETYQQAANRAKQGQDPVGQMMAINNLAATYLVMNDVDQAQQLLKQGLDLSLESGEGRYIASAYSMMSQIYLQKNQPLEAIGHIQEALKYQLKSQSGRGLNPKLMTLNYLLVVTFQSQQAQALLELTQHYAEQLNQSAPMAIVQLYQGMNLAHQKQWSAAADRLQAAWQASQVNNFNYQRPMLLAYFALSHARSEQPIKAIEAAQKVMELAEAQNHEKTLAKLALAWSYLFLENTQQYNQAVTDLNESDIESWLFLAEQFWELKLINANQSDLSYESYLNRLEQTRLEQQNLSGAARVDDVVMKSLQDKILSLTAALKREHAGAVSQPN